eukprot:c14601_g1_i1 orf=255-557(-)
MAGDGESNRVIPLHGPLSCFTSPLHLVHAVFPMSYLSWCENTIDVNFSPPRYKIFEAKRLRRKESWLAMSRNYNINEHGHVVSFPAAPQISIGSFFQERH